MKRIKFGKEPVLKIHRYVVTIGYHTKGKDSHWHLDFEYAMNLAEVEAIKDAARKGSIIEVYKAHHDFKEAWEK